LFKNGKGKKSQKEKKKKKTKTEKPNKSIKGKLNVEQSHTLRN